MIKNDYRSIGELMNVNQGLLDSLGVCVPELWLQINAARQHGAYGAKITGAGGGGCMVAICDETKCKDIATAIGGPTATASSQGLRPKGCW